MKYLSFKNLVEILEPERLKKVQGTITQTISGHDLCSRFRVIMSKTANECPQILDNKFNRLKWVFVVQEMLV